MSDLKALVHRLDSMIQFAAGGIVSKTLVEEDFGEVSLFMMAKGQGISEHTSSRHAVVHVLQGKGIVQLDGVDHQVEPGSWIFMPANLPHALQADEDLVFLLTLFG